MTTFGYDASDQLTSEVRDNSHSTGYSVSYAYDHNQNRTSKTLNSVTDTYTYDSHDKLTSTSNKSYSYDNNGNCTSVTAGSNTTTLTYDDANRVTGITYPSTATNSFAYNGLGLRVSKTDSSGTFAYVCDGTDPASPVLQDGAATYTPGLSERRGTTSKFQHSDALGSTRGITDSSQATTDSVLYDAFGMTVSRTGSTPTPFGFVGGSPYQTDSDSGLMLLGHRYYDASIGRFISSDPAQAGTNWYAYCENNPLKRADRDGLDFISQCIVFVTHTIDPTDGIGLLYALGGTATFDPAHGVIFVQGGIGNQLFGSNYSAITLGHYILYPEPPDAATIAHELVHVQQHDHLGGLYLPAVIGGYGVGPLISLNLGEGLDLTHDANPLELSADIWSGYPANIQGNLFQNKLNQLGQRKSCSSRSPFFQRYGRRYGSS